jgi:hypothetical protein
MTSTLAPPSSDFPTFSPHIADSGHPFNQSRLLSRFSAAPASGESYELANPQQGRCGAAMISGGKPSFIAEKEESRPRAESDHGKVRFQAASHGQ